MAVPTINFGGFVYDDSGDAVSGATVNLFDKNDTSTSRASTTTNSSGYWAIAHTTSGEFDVQITSGSSKRRIKFDDAIQLTSIDTEVLKVRANEGAIAAIELYADEGEDASDRWRIDAGTDGVLAFGNDIASQGTYEDLLTVTPHATATSSTVTVAGILDVDGTTNLDAVDIDGAVQIDNTVTVGVDDTSFDVKIFGASAGAYMLYDNSEDRLEIRGPSADATTSTGKLLLSTALTNINANDVLGKIEFQAPLEAGGTDAITVAAGIQAVAQSTFAADSNATDLIFYTGHSEAATEKFRFTSQGELGIGGATYGSSGDVLTSGGAGAAPTWETPTTGDITGVTAGVGLSGGGSSGTVTVTLDLSELSAVTPANGDSLATIDSDGSTEQLTTIANLATLFAGTGLSASSSVLSIDAAQTGINSLLATDIKIGEDDQTKIDFEDANKINFYANNSKEVELAENSLSPGTSDGTALGTTSLMWSDLFLASAGVINFNNGDVTLTHASNTVTLAGGNLALTDASVQLDSGPSDETVSGITASFTAGEDLVRGEVVYYKPGDSKMWKAVATAAATSKCVAMAAADISADAAGVFLLRGFLQDNGSFPSYTAGDTLYTPEAETSSQNVPETAAPDTDGDFVQIIGWAVDANSVYFDPDSTIVEVA